MNLWQPLLFHSSIIFVIETVLFISEQTAEYRFKALLEISGKFSARVSYMILQCWLSILNKFTTILYNFEKRCGRVVLIKRASLCHQSSFV